LILSAQSPAKLNLFLHITGRRPDGYHNLQTLFQFVDFCDRLEFERTPDHSAIQVEPALAGVPAEQNLIWRAARLLQDTTGCTQGARIKLHKQLPMGGGLGGGSSNAATTLVALNHLWQTGLNRDALCTLGLKLGADVPIFVHGHAALAHGVGERFEDVNVPEPWYLIAIPACHAPTAELFQEKQLTRDSDPITICAFLDGAGHNDFEPVLRKRFPLIDRCLHLMDTVSKAKVTGSGACLFCSFADEQSARSANQQLLERMPAFSLTHQDVSWRIAKGLNRSPLYSGCLANLV
jgi:4-diphosphocytidyl-2-C-methyl-D-erythritol kinase